MKALRRLLAIIIAIAIFAVPMSALAETVKTEGVDENGDKYTLIIFTDKTVDENGNTVETEVKRTETEVTDENGKKCLPSGKRKAKRL